MRQGLSHKQTRSFFFCRPSFPHQKKGYLMSQAGFSLFPPSQQHSIISYGDILNTPVTSRDRMDLHGSGSSDSITSLPGHFGSGSSLSPDTSLLSPAPISLYTSSSLTTSSSPGSPRRHAYTHLARQFQQCQEELKKINHEYGRLKYVSLFTNAYISNVSTEQRMRT
jgi:hypothetical protein